MRHLFAILPLPLFAVVNLGHMGPTFDIDETDIKTQLQRGIKGIDPEKVREQVLDSITHAKTVSPDIPACVEERHHDMPSIYMYSSDVTDIDGNILHRKGESVEIETKFRQVLCIVDGRTEEALQRSVEMVTKEGSCDKTMIAEGSVDMLPPSQSVGKVYPYHPLLTHSLGASCFPARITLKGTRIFFDEFGDAQ